MFSKHFQAEIWNPHNFCVPPKCDSFFFKQLKILFKIYISSYQWNIQKQMTGQIWPKGYTLPIPATKELMGDSLVAQRLKRLPPMRETRVWFLGREDPLEKEMAIHSSTLAWKIPWMEEPGRLQSMGSQRVGHDWATSFSHGYLGLPWWLSSKKICLLMQEMWVWSLVQEDPGEGNGNLFQYSCLENPKNRGVW